MPLIASSVGGLQPVSEGSRSAMRLAPSAATQRSAGAGRRLAG
jgi:hypothetical protein